MPDLRKYESKGYYLLKLANKGLSDLYETKIECRGRDSNPRRATPLGPQPSAFDRSTTPADQIIK